MGRGQTKATPSVEADAEQACPITPVVELVFSRWTTPILWVLRHHGRVRFNELESLLAPVTPKVLTLRLRQLERDGLITRTYYPEMPPRVEYEISELGRTLTPVFSALVKWSNANLESVQSARARYDNEQLPGRGH
ncbi:winged helix-turn-helix transcriptional regulator [Nocardia sp. Marseille-Q1738]